MLLKRLYGKMIQNIRPRSPSSLVMATGRQTTLPLNPSIAASTPSVGEEILPRRWLLCARTKITLPTTGPDDIVARGRCGRCAALHRLCERNNVQSAACTRDGRRGRCFLTLLLGSIIDAPFVLSFHCTLKDSVLVRLHPIFQSECN